MYHNMFLIPVIIAITVSNIIWCMVSYDPSIRMGTYAYHLCVFGGLISSFAWCYMIRNLQQSQQYIANVMWDVGVTLIFLILPLTMYHIKMDLKTGIGTAVAVIGLIIIKS
jgi:uncharacterized membrane protein